MPQVGDCAHDPAGKIDDDHDQQGPENDQTVFRQKLQVLHEHRDGKGADNGPGQGSSSPQEKIYQPVEGQLERGRAGADTAHQTGVNAAGHRGEKIGHHKRQDLPGKGVDPHRLGEDFIVPDGHETQPHEGIDQPVHDQQGEEQESQNQVILGSHGLKTDLPDQGEGQGVRQRDPHDAVVAPGKLDPVAGHNGDDDSEAHRGDGKIGPPGPKGGQPDQKPDQGREKGRQRKGQPERQPSFRHERHPVSPDAEKTGVGQGGLAGVAQDQVQAEGGDGEKAAHDYDLKVVAIGDQQGKSQGQDQQEHIKPFLGQESFCRHQLTSLPNSPVGRMERIRIRAPKA